MSNEGGESPSAFDFKLFAESLRGDICRILDQKLEIVHERIDKVEAVQSGSKGSGNRRKSAPHESDSSNYSVEEFEPRTRRTKVNFKSKREPIKGVKMQVPPFVGKRIQMHTSNRRRRSNSCSIATTIRRNNK